VQFPAGRLLRKGFDVLNLSDRHDGEGAQMRPDDQGLSVVIADDSDAPVSLKIGQILLEFGTEIIVFDIVNGSLIPVGVADGKPAAPGPQMGMVIRSVKQIVYTVIFRGDSKESSHTFLPSNQAILPPEALYTAFIPAYCRVQPESSFMLERLKAGFDGYGQRFFRSWISVVVLIKKQKN
jgi:hypothetical protein